MGNVQLIKVSDANGSWPVVHFGWDEKELATIKQDYQATFFGRTLDVLLEVFDDKGDCYYAVFRSDTYPSYIKKNCYFFVYCDLCHVFLLICYSFVVYGATSRP